MALGYNYGWKPRVTVGALLPVVSKQNELLVFYKLNSDGSQDDKDSDLFALGLSAAYRYLHRPYPGASNSARLGLVWGGEGRAGRNGRRLVNSGAQQLILRPALGFHPVPAVDISSSIDLPLYQHYEGQPSGFGFRTFIAFGYRF